MPKNGRTASLAAGTDLQVLTLYVPQGSSVGKLNIFGLRWHSAVINPLLQNLICNAVMSSNIGSYGPRYEELYDSNPDAELNVLLRT